ncbi:coenzyme F420 hydrogenase subunit delta/hydrogenase maturation protease [Geothermobacter ehrlichii]|uniref:Coenzyme F420 hydrogenase subunit delta/hydrogenase maturation protease n=2 Tax=Geothermobacter ehrlichii TaxID=213224 RepID=A0A5D3WH39_9BACT|nr:coenzyme F420 hydrogenase subunit delta/hydrogenase maturation protease [Geothermobacter ehrlichii]
MGDDGVGPAVIERLRQRPLPAGVTVEDGGLCGLSLLDFWRGYRRVWLVDAVDMGMTAGSCRWIDLGLEAPAGGEAFDAHGDLAPVLALARELGEWPYELLLLAVQPQRVEPGLALSPAVARGVKRAAAMIVSRLATE